MCVYRYIRMSKGNRCSFFKIFFSFSDDILAKKRTATATVLETGGNCPQNKLSFDTKLADMFNCPNKVKQPVVELRFLGFYRPFYKEEQRCGSQNAQSIHDNVVDVKGSSKDGLEQLDDERTADTRSHRVLP